MSRRTERVGQQLMGEIARLLREEVTDPRIGLVTLTRVDVAPDLSHAVVYWSALDDSAESVARVASGLDSAAAFVRRRLASSLELKRTPELRFRHDPSLSQGSDTLALLKSLSNGETP